jgi:hypothetical protein
MNPASVSTPNVAPPVRKRRWWLHGMLAAVALAIVMPLALVTYSDISSRGAWADAEDEASRDDPRWRLMEIEADRTQVADVANA